MVEIYEDNGGHIYAVVKKESNRRFGMNRFDVVNIIDGFESSLLTGKRFISVAKEEFRDVDAFDPERYAGRDMDSVASEILKHSQLIAVFCKGGYWLFPLSMGPAGKDLFEIK